MAFDSPKAQAAGVTFTYTTWVLTIFSYIPDILSVIAAVMGIILTWVMISKALVDRKKSKLSVKLMERKILCESCKEEERG